MNNEHFESEVALLERIAKLRDSGLLSEEEYRAEKAKILDLKVTKQRRRLSKEGKLALAALVGVVLILGLILLTRTNSTPSLQSSIPDTLHAVPVSASQNLPDTSSVTAPDHYADGIRLASLGQRTRAFQEFAAILPGDLHYYDAVTKMAQLRPKMIQDASASTISLRQVLKSPSEYLGKPVAWRGRVMQISEEAGRTHAQIAYYENGSSTPNNFFIDLNGSTDLLEGDWVAAYGVIKGVEDYTSRANYRLTSPSLAGISAMKLDELSSTYSPQPSYGTNTSPDNDPEAVRQLIANYYSAVFNHRIDEAISYWHSGKLLKLNTGLMYRMADSTSAYRLQSVTVEAIDQNGATCTASIVQRKIGYPQAEHWIVPVKIIREGYEWKLWSMQGGRLVELVNYP